MNHKTYKLKSLKSSEMKLSNSQIRQDRLCSHCTHQEGRQDGDTLLHQLSTLPIPRRHLLPSQRLWQPEQPHLPCLLVKSSCVLDEISKLLWQEKNSPWITTTTRWSETTDVFSPLFWKVDHSWWRTTLATFLIGWRNNAVRKRASWNSRREATE